MGLDSVFASSKIIRNKTMAQSVNKAKRMDEWNERAQILIGWFGWNHLFVAIHLVITII